VANPSDHYDPLADLGHAVDKMPIGALSTPPDKGQAGPAGVGRFDPTANTGTTTVEKLPLQSVSTPPDTGLRLPPGADNFDSLNLGDQPNIPRPAEKRFHTGGRNT
jgi:hypothetical protein